MQLEVCVPGDLSPPEISPAQGCSRADNRAPEAWVQISGGVGKDVL